MRKISLWAKSHKWSSRIIIIVSTIILACIGVYFGEDLRLSGFSFSNSFYIVLCCIFFLAILAYPYRDQKAATGKSRYAYRKLIDFIVITCSFGMFIYGGNHPEKLVDFKSGLHASVPLATVHSKDPKPYKTLTDFYKSLKDENGKLLKWKERKKLLKEQLKGIKSAKQTSNAAKVLLTILSILVALGLLSLVAAVACGLSCDGYGAAAAVVGIGGTAVIIFLLIITIRAIHGIRRKRVKDPVKMDTGM